jgi:hypothetical protein
MEAEWKSADEIAADLAAGEVDLRQVALGLAACGGASKQD